MSTSRQVDLRSAVTGCHAIGLCRLVTSHQPSVMSARTVHVFSLIPNLTRLLIKRCSGLKFKEIPVPENKGFDYDGELDRPKLMYCSVLTRAVLEDSKVFTSYF